MSSTLNHTLSVWEDVLAQLGCTSVSWKGFSLSDRDLKTFTEAIVMSSLHLIDLSSRHEGIGNEREIIAWAKFMVTLDVSSLGSFLSDAVLVLRQVSAPTSYNWFKRQLRTDYPFVGQFCAPIRGALQDFLEDPNPRGFYVCNQFFSFLTHLSLKDLNQDLESEYVELEARLQTYVYPVNILNRMNEIMRSWLVDFHVGEDNFLPQHGPGATAETPRVATFADKYRHLWVDDLLDYVFRKYAGVDVTTYYPAVKQGSNRQSHVVFVPKSMKTYRVISKEPCTLMYLQQGVAKCIKEYVQSHDDLRSHIDFEDQSHNGRMALKGSADQRFATIDLSSASDTVTLELVKAVFRGTPLYPFLVALRSKTTVLPSGKVQGMAKYAPMGSALCFPIMTLILACAVEFVVRYTQDVDGISYHRYRVYGDDIVVHEEVFRDLMVVLELIGFIPNQHKSFCFPSLFRESCGVEAYDGVDVTPMKISRKFSFESRITSKSASVYENRIDMANTAYLFDFPLLRSWIVRSLLANHVAPPLFSEEVNSGIYSPWPDNYRADSRFNTDYQRREIHVAGVRMRRKKLLFPDETWAEYAQYFETLRLLSARTEDDEFELLLPIHVDARPSLPVLTKTWVEKPW